MPPAEVVILGGGVVGDLAGFAAAVLLRGVDFIQVPTTLLAQVDSSVGGKVGINLPGAKNMVGAFWQPCGVTIDVDVLKTLPDREYRAGLAEVAKYGVIQDAEFFAYLEANVAAINARHEVVLAYIVERCCRLKADVVEQDEREETGLRAILNYGHTFGHAFEAATGYEALLHGEAVAIGMVQEASLAASLGYCGHDVAARIQAVVAAAGLPHTLPRWTERQIWHAMQHDKKVVQGTVHGVWPERIGSVRIAPLHRDAFARWYGAQRRGRA